MQFVHVEIRQVCNIFELVYCLLMKPFSIGIKKDYGKTDKQSSTANKNSKQQHIDRNDMGRGPNERHIDPAS